MKAKEKLILFFLIFLGSCAQLSIVSNGDIPVTFSSAIEQGVEYREIGLDGRLDYYLWGALPGKHQIEIDQQLEDLSIMRANVDMIRFYRTGADWTYAIISMGMYAPLHYEIKAKGERMIQNVR